MTTERLLQIIKDRGFRLKLLSSGEPCLVGNGVDATDELKAVLKLRVHREAIIARLRTEAESAIDIPDFSKPIECLWANGYRCPHWFPESGWPCGARWWRQVGGMTWRRIPGVPVSPLEPLGPDGQPAPNEPSEVPA